MAKKDNLTLDVIACMKNGYGCHYGNYKADHPHTGGQGEEKDPVGKWKWEHKCAYCGKQFKGWKTQRYCSNECSRLNYDKNQREAYNERMMNRG